ncbi:unnamed protein product [Soboliphyme baturini]|uniref:VASt domain-containing protein n=1 Tax=Soboliphyme baturini TaxID=241478 RepID=A0A183IIC6_9BILA|nr:unnamed protein product [Soboliphyme baturini]
MEPSISTGLVGFITTNTEISNHMMAFRGLQNDLWSDGIFTQKVDMFMKPELREDSATRAVRQLGMGVRKQHLKQPQEESAVEKRKKKKCLKGPGLFCDQIPRKFHILCAVVKY